MSKPVSNRVVSLNSLGRDRSPGQRILSECRDRLITELCQWLQDVAATISEEMFVLADSTRERLLQTRYLDLRADIEKDWVHLVASFRRELAAQSERCQNDAGAREADADAALELPDFEGLQLLADEDLSEHIVIREFSAQLAESCDEELYTLDRRVAILLGHEQVEDSVNPLAPAIICTALADACATLGPDADARLILMRRVERHLHRALPGIYQKINANLIERGILPDLKRNFRRSSIKGGNVNDATHRGSASTANTEGVDSGQGILEALQRLAEARATQALAGTGHATGPLTAGRSKETTAVTPDALMINRLLLSSLDELQHARPGEGGGVIVNQVRVVRDSENAQHVGGLAAVTIDIVAMLFDFIFDDVHVPLAVKALISRLQIPVLKVAMLNPGFFADRRHPTRRFLGSISGVAIRWGEAVDQSDPFYAKLAELVERIQAEFENDVQVFGTALVELEAFVNAVEADEESTTRTAAQIVMQREREAEAWKRAQHAVHVFCSSHPLPKAVEAFLGEHWVGVLQASAVEDDAQGESWTAATEVMNKLAWSIAPKRSPADRLKLIDLLPGLLGQINQGLDTIAASSDQRTAFFDALVKCHAAALRGETVSEATPGMDLEVAVKEPAIASSSMQEGDLLVTRSINQGVRVEEVTLVGACPMWRADEREIFRQVSELKRGDWVEFREVGDSAGAADIADEPTRSTRERLTWISPQRGILLFSNHRSSKAISIAPEALARQIRDGNAEIIREEPIFERALNGALETMNAH